MRGVRAQATGAVLDERKLTDEGQLSVGPTWSWGEQSQLTLRVGYARWHDQFLLDQRRSNALDSFARTVDQQLEVSGQYDQELGEHMVLTQGVEYLLDALTSQRTSEARLRGRLGLYVQDEISLGGGGQPTLVIVPGFRLDVDSQFGASPSPKVVVRFDPHPATGIRGSWGLGYRAPSFKEQLMQFENPSGGYVIEGNPELLPERSHGVGLGVLLRPLPFLDQGAPARRHGRREGAARGPGSGDRGGVGGAVTTPR